MTRHPREGFYSIATVQPRRECDSKDDMKIRYVAALACAGLTVAGCASNRGGTYESSDSAYQTWDTSMPNTPDRQSSPTFRPGMDREDPRDPQFLTRPGTLNGSTPP